MRPNLLLRSLVPAACLVLLARTFLREFEFQTRYVRITERASPVVQSGPQCRDSNGTLPARMSCRAPNATQYRGPPGAPKRIAMVVPFIDSQVPKVRAGLRRWREYAPCAPHSAFTNTLRGADGDRVHLVFAYDGDFRSPAGLRVKALLQRYVAEDAGHAACFAEPEFLSMGLDKTWKHIEGAAAMFYPLFDLLEPRYDAFFLAEGDVMPVQSNWVAALMGAATHLSCSGTWQMGSPPRHLPSFGNLIERQDRHLNGNALYKLGCPEFLDYLCRAQTRFRCGCRRAAGCKTDAIYEEGYDHVLFRYRQREPVDPQAVLDRVHFEETAFVQNRGEEMYDAAALVAASPETVFVHSKAVHFSAAQEAVSRTYTGVFGEYATPHANAHAHTLVKTGEYTEAALTRELCALGDGALDKSVFAPNAACDPYRSADGAVLPATWPDGRVDPDAAYLWTADFDASTTTCNLPVLRAANIVVHAEVDAEDCAAHGMCPKRLDPLLRNNGGHGLSLETPDLDHEALAAAFYARYKDDAEFARVDAFLCSYPAANCELFVPFDKPLVVYVTTRLEFGRFDSGLAWRKGLMKADAHERWEAWVHVVQNVAKDPRNTVAANSRYDVAYVKYHTGVDAAYLPTWCGDDDGAFRGSPPNELSGWFGSNIVPDYTPTRPEVVLVPFRSAMAGGRDAPIDGNETAKSQHPIYVSLQAALQHRPSSTTQVAFMSDLYATEDAAPLAFHRALVLVPSQVSSTELTAMYRLNVPLFVPSLRLLRKWSRAHDILWERHVGWADRVMHGDTDAPNPSLETNEAFNFWVGKSDFYTRPHITTFETWDEFLAKLEETDLFAVSALMREENARERAELVEAWRAVGEKVIAARPLESASLEGDDDALDQKQQGA